VSGFFRRNPSQAQNLKITRHWALRPDIGARGNHEGIGDEALSHEIDQLAGFVPVWRALLDENRGQRDHGSFLQVMIDSFSPFAIWP
jgi:hypothetical protein